MNVTENLKLIAVAHAKANRITMSCENSQHIETAIAYIKNLKRLCANLNTNNIHELAYIKQVTESVDSTLKLKRKSLK
jgi:pentose-5-phosphate-3-epimerase